MIRPLRLAESADLLGRYRYVELALFHALGARSTSAEDPVAVTYLAGAARAHAWRARLVEERLPVSLGLPGIEASTRSPGRAFDEIVARVRDRAVDDELLFGLVAVLYPAMSSAYRGHLGACSPAADGPVIRTLRRLVADLEAVRDEGDSLAHLGASGALARELERLLDEDGGPFGPLVATNDPSRPLDAFDQVRPS